MKTTRRSKKQDPSPKMELEEIIGLTTKNSNGLASNTSSFSCAYVAGCAVVVYNVDTGRQSHLMVSHRTPRPLSCVALSQDGRFVAAGELGAQPAVLIWERSTMAFISELKDHLFGVDCIAFSPDGEHLVSVGGYIYLWDWRSGQLITKLKASSSCSSVTSVSFSADAKLVVTAGKKHLKCWTVGSSPGIRSRKGTLSITMHGKPVNLGLQKGSSFTSVTSATLSSVNKKQAVETFPIYALTNEGVLCLVDCGLSVTKSVDLKVQKGFALSASDKLIACACSDGIVQLFTREDLNYAGMLQYTKSKSYQGKPDGFPQLNNTEQAVSSLPDAVACQFSDSEKLVVVYGDSTLCIWDVHDPNQATKQCVLVSHSEAIWDVKSLCCENLHDPSLACVARGCSGGVSFATCSADGTIRLWDLAQQPDFADDEADYHISNRKSMATSRLVSAGIFVRDTKESNFSTRGFRSMAASSDGKYLAAGDLEGNLHIFNLNSFDYTCFQGVHDSEILSLSFSLSKDSCDVSEEVISENYLLASGGRDRAIHLYDAKRNFDLMGSIDDHSAAVTSVRLTSDGHKLLSCSADRSLVFRDVSMTDNGHKILHRHNQIASNGTVYDMAIDPRMECVVSVGQDKKINTFNIASGKLIRSFKGDNGLGDPVKVTMDPSCSFLICCYSNKFMCMYDANSGELILQAVGHGEVVNGVIFLPDCQHVVSVSSDGCIFIWKLPACITATILQRMKEYSSPLTFKELVLPTAFNTIIYSEVEDKLKDICPETVTRDFYPLAHSVLDQGGGPRRVSTFRFSISKLPRWAQSKVQDSSIQVNQGFTNSQPEKQEEKILSPLVCSGDEYDPSSHESPTPFNHKIQGNFSCLGSLSKSSPQTIDRGNSSMSQVKVRDNNWRNVYTVCIDLLKSPQAELLTGPMMPVFSSTLKHSAKRPKDAGLSKGNTYLIADTEHKSYQRTNALSSKCELLDNTIDNQNSEDGNLWRLTTKCREALLQLDSAARNVFNIFTELETQALKREDSKGCRTMLFDEAGKILPSIGEKLDTVAEMVQCRNKISGGTSRVKDLGFEPLLEKFAENLSQKVLEMVKMNLNKD